MKRFALAFLLIAALSVSTAHAAPNVTLVEAANNPLDQASYTIGPHTVHGGRLIFIAFFTLDLGGPHVVNSITGHGCSWSFVVSRDNGSDRKISSYRCAIGSDDTGSITINFSRTQSRIVAVIVEASDADTTGTGCSGGIVQCPTQFDSTGADLTITFNAYGSSNNRPFVFATSNTVGTTGVTMEAGWTELADLTAGTEAARSAAAWATDTDDTTATFTWDSGTNAVKLAIGVEIKSATEPPAAAGQQVIGGGVSHGGPLQ